MNWPPASVCVCRLGHVCVSDVFNFEAMDWLVGWLDLDWLVHVVGHIVG